MLLSAAQITVDEGWRLSRGVVARFGLRQSAPASSSFWAIVKLKAVDGAEASARISMFDLDLDVLPSRFEWSQARATRDFNGDYMEYILEFFRERSMLQVFFQSLPYGVAIKVAICGQEAYGLLKTEMLTGDKYFSIPEPAAAK